MRQQQNGVKDEETIGKVRNGEDYQLDSLHESTHISVHDDQSLYTETGQKC